MELEHILEDFEPNICDNRVRRRYKNARTRLADAKSAILLSFVRHHSHDKYNDNNYNKHFQLQQLKWIVLFIAANFGITNVAMLESAIAGFDNVMAKLIIATSNVKTD
jgi:hypothetical protein